MAIKGIGIEPEVYLLPGYANPEDYATPHHTSFGDYATPQTYFEADYVLNALDLVSTFTIQAEGTVFSTRATPASEFTLSVTYERFRDTDPIALSTDTQVSITGQLDFDFAVLRTFRAFTPRFLRAVVTDIGHMPDATWNTYAESEYIDRTWDEFSDYQWDYLVDLFIRSTFTKALGGYLAKATATLTAFNNASMTMTRLREFSATPPTVSNMSVNANYTTGTPQTITAAFAQTGSVTRFRDIVVSGQAQQFTAINTMSANANFTSRSTVVEYTGEVTVSGNATTVFETFQTLNTAFQQQVDANYNIASASTSLSAFYSNLAVGRLITLPDPFNTIKVPQEIRTLVVPIENNIIEVLGETRVNKVITEMRAIKVKQETRNFKIMRPGFTDRSSIPRVRQET
jgi:hypothetical protein